MNNADNIVKINACKKATNNSNTFINNAIGTERNPHAALWNVNMIPTNDKIIM